MNGILILNKPKGFTSFDVIAKLRGILNIKKIGHAGTLDPMATGVLPILIGSATKVQDLFTNTDKEYFADFQLGISTDTQDITGKIIKKTDFLINKNQIEETLKNFKGEIFQIPPMYSAVKYNGERLYFLARRGVNIEREKRPIFISNIELCEFDEKNGTGKIKVNCSKGTYIRTICNDIGDALGCGATLTELVRTKACGFNINESVSLSEVENLNKYNKLTTKIRSIDSIFFKYRNIKVTPKQTIRFKNGGALDLCRINITDVFDKEIIRVYDFKNHFIGLGEICIEKNELKIFKLF